MPVGGIQKIQNEWIDQRKIPERVIGIGWRQLCNPEPWIRKPGNEANIIGLQIPQSQKCRIMNR